MTTNFTAAEKLKTLTDTHERAVGELVKMQDQESAFNREEVEQGSSETRAELLSSIAQRRTVLEGKIRALLDVMIPAAEAEAEAERVQAELTEAAGLEAEFQALLACRTADGVAFKKAIFAAVDAAHRLGMAQTPMVKFPQMSLEMLSFFVSRTREITTAFATVDPAEVAAAEKSYAEGRARATKMAALHERIVALRTGAARVKPVAVAAVAPVQPEPDPESVEWYAKYRPQNMVALSGIGAPSEDTKPSRPFATPQYSQPFAPSK